MSLDRVDVAPRALTQANSAGAAGRHLTGVKKFAALSYSERSEDLSTQKLPKQKGVRWGLRTKTSASAHVGRENDCWDPIVEKIKSPEKAACQDRDI